MEAPPAKRPEGKIDTLTFVNAFRTINYTVTAALTW